MEMILEAKDISFSYGKGCALDGLSLGIEQGSLVCLMGRNGSGKTTLLDCLMGALVPSRGCVELLGRPVGKYRRHEIARHISYLPQIHGITFPYTVREMVMLGRMAYASAFGSPRQEDEEACDEAMQKAGVYEFRDQAYSSLSGGEIRLVLLARALCQRSEIILMDEPTVYLDFRNEMLFLQRVAELTAEGRATVVMATHSPNHAFYFESRGLSVQAALLDKGKLVALGAPSEVITADSAARFFGVEAEIAAAGGVRNLVVKNPL